MMVRALSGPFRDTILLLQAISGVGADSIRVLTFQALIFTVRLSQRLRAVRLLRRVGITVVTATML